MSAGSPDLTRRPRPALAAAAAAAVVVVGKLTTLCDDLSPRPLTVAGVLPLLPMATVSRQRAGGAAELVARGGVVIGLLVLLNGFCSTIKSRGLISLQ